MKETKWQKMTHEYCAMYGFGHCEPEWVPAPICQPSACQLPELAREARNFPSFSEYCKFHRPDGICGMFLEGEDGFPLRDEYGQIVHTQCERTGCPFAKTASEM